MTTLLAILFVAQPPTATSGLAARQERLREQFNAFDARLRQAAETLRAIDPQRSALLSQASEQSRAALLERQLERIAAHLKNAENGAAATDAESLAAAVKEQQKLLAQIDAVVALLLSDDQAKLAKEKQEQILRRLQEIKELERDQRDVRSLTDRAKDDAETGKLADPQGDLADRAKRMEADDPAGDPSPKKPESGGDMKTVREAMEKAKKSLENRKKNDAKKRQQEALEELAKETEKLAKVLRQMRQEERLGSLMSLEARCRKLLDGEKSLQDKATALDRAASKERTRVELRQATDLAAVQRGLVVETEATLAFVREDNVAVAFDETLVIVKDDMTRIEGRLRNAETGAVVQALVGSVVATLADMCGSLQREIAESRERQTEEGDGGGQDRDALLDLLAELRLLKSLQVQIEKRTALAAKLGATGAAPLECAETLAQLAQRQARVYEMTRELSARHPKR